MEWVPNFGPATEGRALEKGVTAETTAVSGPVVCCRFGNRCSLCGGGKQLCIGVDGTQVKTRCRDRQIGNDIRYDSFHGKDNLQHGSK